MSVGQDQPTAESTSRYADVGDARIHYHETGEGHPVVLLHGSGPGATGWSNYRENIGHLSRSFRVLVPDMPGWGASSTVSFEDRDHVRDLLGLLDARGVEKAAIVGNSMGAGTALLFAAEHPDRVSHVVTMGSGAAGTSLFAPAGGPSEGLKVLRRAYRDPSPEQMRRLVEVMTYAADDAADELVTERSRTARARQDHLDNFIAGMERGRRRAATAQQLGSITAPVLIIHGRDDRVVSFESSLRLLALVPDARLVAFNRCGHWAQLEHAAEFNRLVTDFVAHG
ncbi:alpha/beta fold hydrolase [Actinomadura sp. LOL_016]|uniref:alpha/beta fold hydrolase n=1 Tax=unclassified Actinomadura TaxID=2626254 RepID=UPI003A80C478